MAEKVLAFEVTDDMGAQYINTVGETIFVGGGDIVTNADPKLMYVEAMVKGKKVKALKYGWKEIKNYLKPATPVDIKLAESARLKELSDENLALKAKLEASEVKEDE